MKNEYKDIPDEVREQIRDFAIKVEQTLHESVRMAHNPLIMIRTSTRDMLVQIKSKHYWEVNELKTQVEQLKKQIK